MEPHLLSYNIPSEPATLQAYLNSKTAGELDNVRAMVASMLAMAIDAPGTDGGAGAGARAEAGAGAVGGVKGGVGGGGGEVQAWDASRSDDMLKQQDRTKTLQRTLMRIDAHIAQVATVAATTQVKAGVQ